MEVIAAQMAAARPDGLLLVAAVQRGTPAGGGRPLRVRRQPADMAAHAARLADLGIDLVGGCCGSTPDAHRRHRRHPGCGPMTSWTNWVGNQSFTPSSIAASP